MSDEEKDAVVGRIVRESKENKEHIALLASESARLGARLRTVADGLISHPEGVIQDGQGIDLGWAKQRVSLLAGDFDVDKIIKLTNDYRQALETKKHLDTQLRQLGFGPESR